MKKPNEIKSVLTKKISNFPELLIVLGSGWNEVLKSATIETEISYADLFGVKTSVPGHQGKLVIATVKGKRVAFMAGRFHIYEGYTSEEATRPIQAFAQVGLKKVVVTSAAGALNEKYRVGDFVVLSDVITMLCQTPLLGSQFIDMSECFDGELRKAAIQACAQAKLAFHEGVYVYAHGPHFETPADKMFLRHIGADVVGMSTVPETIMARSLGIKVLGLSFVTNLAFVAHRHEDVLAAANQGSAQMVKLLEGIIEKA